MTDKIKDPDIVKKDRLEDVADDVDSYPVMPLRNTVLFPQQVIPTYIGRERSLKLIDDLPQGKKLLVVVAQEDGSMENPEPDDLYAWGTLAVVLKVFDMPDKSKSAIIQGLTLEIHFRSSSRLLLILLMNIPVF